MSDMVYAPCEHGRLGCPPPRPLGTVEDIERALAKAAAYNNAERIEWEHAGDWHRLVPEIGDTE